MAKTLATLAIFALAADANVRDRDPTRERPSSCTQTAEECKTFLQTAPACEAWVKGSSSKADFFDEATCCPTCKREKPAGRADGAKCAKEDVKTCIMAARPCGDDEVAEMEAEQCCKTCADKRHKHDLVDVARCAKVDECAAGSEPTQAADDKCPSCRPAKPALVCPAECEGKKVCRENRAKDANICVGKKPVKKFKMKVKAGAKQGAKAFAADATNEEIREAILEAVDRFCENPDHNPKPCDKQQEVDENLIVKITERRAAKDEVDFDVELPEEPTSRRLADGLADDDGMDLVEHALNENYDTEIGFEEDAGTGDKDKGAADDSKSAAWIKGASLALCMGLLLLV